MIRNGLVSVSFRKLSCEEITDAARKCGLGGIEWGGDIHVPAGNTDEGRRIKKMTEEAGLKVNAYGSYYRAGTYGKVAEAEFGKVLLTAEALGAPVIRIWAGTKPSADVSRSERMMIVDECRAIADEARKKNISIAFECHNFTLTDDADSALKLMDEIGRENFGMFWQPNERKSFSYNVTALQKILPFLFNVHVFNWRAPEVKRPLAENADEWREYCSIISSDGRDHWCNLEFMPDDRISSLAEESKTMMQFTE